MSKSLYSVILSDDVVKAIDVLAYKNGTNRSGMINRILAEAVSLKTPEMRLGEIFKYIENVLCSDDVFQLNAQPSDTMMSLRSALPFKYNPTVQYNVFLEKTSNGMTAGELRVSMRTQNAALIRALQQFYVIWIDEERKYIDGVEYQIDGFKLTRKLYFRKESKNSFEDLVTEYIKIFDKAIKAYFMNLNNPVEAENIVRKIFRDGFVI
ncbi:MAG: hypothetical protein MJ236_05850 [Clostridia bacterium]|nr:hypothetical protein [Clostridia bacterium]